MADQLTFEEFKIRHDKSKGTWKWWPLMECNIPVVLAWCAENSKNSYCVKVPSWARTSTIADGQGGRPKFTILFANASDRSAIRKDLGDFDRGLKMKYKNIVADDDYKFEVK